MAAMVKEECKAVLEQQQLEVRNMVLAGLEQIKQDRTKDFHEVCDRLEKKYKDAAIHN